MLHLPMFGRSEMRSRDFVVVRSATRVDLLEAAARLVSQARAETWEYPNADRLHGLGVWMGAGRAQRGSRRDLTCRDHERVVMQDS
jgi:hypothetical protein